MKPDALLQRLREVCGEPMPLPAQGKTAERHRRLIEIGREDLSLARLAEAHFDAVAILAEAGREAHADVLYGVWAAEIPGQPLQRVESATGDAINGRKLFASGATLLDRALITVEAPEPWLIDVDLRGHIDTFSVDLSGWKPMAFSATKTATVDFHATPFQPGDVLGPRGWYLFRPGFWHGACGPAACWAGGAIGIVDYARRQSRSDPHTLAHLGAMEAAAWALQSMLDTVGNEIDQTPGDVELAHQRALKCRHLIDTLATEILERFGRAYGPSPLAFVDETVARCQELTIYLRQCHAERDLETLGRSRLKPRVGSR